MKNAIFILLLTGIAACTSEPPTLPLPPRSIVQEPPPVVPKQPPAPEPTNEPVPMETKTVPEASGDYDGDGKTEKVVITAPSDYADSKGNDFEENRMVLTVKFPGSAVIPFKFKPSLGGFFCNEGDLDGDGADEMGFVPGRGYSALRTYFVYSYKNGRWIELVSPFQVHLNQFDEGIDFIKKHPSRPDKLIITYLSMDNDGNTFNATKTVSINR